MKKKFLNLFMILSIIIGVTSVNIVNALDMPPMVIHSNSVSYSGATTISEDTNEKTGVYSSENNKENALLVNGGTSTINRIEVTKSGDDEGDSSDFYGTNAGVLVYNGAKLNINGGFINTNGSHANALFAYSNGVINAKNITIKTESNNSGGLMVTGGGILNATNLNIETSGNSSAAIRSDRGGGTIVVDGGIYKTTGVGSPAIYSTADIKVSNATLTSSSSEGVVIEGKNSVTLDNVRLVDTNITLNGNSETYKNIFLYQSMSGDANEGTSTFTSKGSDIVTNKGDVFYVTNTNAVINLENNEFTYGDGDLLRIEAAKWGNIGSNGGNVTLNLTNQSIEGNIILDELSTLNMNLTNKTIFKGSINNLNNANKVDLTIDKNSVILLTADTYINTLNNSLNDNSNIYSNGYNLYVNGEKVKTNEGVFTKIEIEEEKEESKNEEVIETKEKDNTKIYIILGILFIIIIGLIILMIINKNRKRGING